MPMAINVRKKTIADILNRAASDASFRNLLYTDPGAALVGYDLSDSDRAALSDANAVRQALDDWEAPVV